MGSLVLEIGQCGIQIGVQMWDYLYPLQYYENNYLYRKDQNIAHSILIDTEPKVVKPIIENRKKYSYFDPKNIIFHQSGRANNWTLGYFDSKKAVESYHSNTKKTTQKFFNMKHELLDIQASNIPEVPLSMDKTMKENSVLLDSIGDMIRKEIEKIDYYMGTLLIYSLGGGTGSGMGSRIMEELHDNYSGAMIFNGVVFPSQSGESPLQHYNTVLAVSKLQEFSDGVIYFENERIMNYLTYAGGKKTVDSMININDINEYIGSCLGSVLKINDCKNLDRFYFDIISELTPFPQMKYLEVFSSPFSMNKKGSIGAEGSWDSIIGNCLGQVDQEDNEGIDNEQNIDLIKKQKNGNNNDKKFKHQTIALYSLLKSGDIEKSLLNNNMTVRSLERKMQKIFNPVGWNPEAININYHKEKYDKIVDRKSMLTLANRTKFGEILKEINNIAYSKYKAKAYLHWYYKYGLNENDFENCFNVIDGIVDSYADAIYL